MRQIQYWPGHSEATKLGIYKANLVKASNTMQSNPEQHRPFKKPKRFRSAFTTEQINYLEKQYKKFPYINSDHRKKVAAILKLTERTIKIWFQNRRMKEKKETFRECDYDNNCNHSQEFGKDLLSNVPVMLSTNDQRLNSLPILSMTLDATSKTNIDTKEAISKKQNQNTTVMPENNTNRNAKPKTMQLKANYYKESENIEYLSPYFHRQSTYSETIPLPIHSKKATSAPQCNTSAEFSINLCKKYRQDCFSSKSAVDDVNVSGRLNTKKPEPEKPIKATKHANFPDGFSTKMPGLSHAQPEQPKQENMNNQAYYPVMSTIYAPPLMSSGGVLWKPVNVLPVMAHTSPITISGHHGATAPEQTKNCMCNCHGSVHNAPMSFPPNLQNPYAQYVITVPYQHTSPKL